MSNNKINRLFRAAAEVAEPLKYTEFRCPNCRGVASATIENDVTFAECHACGLRAMGRDEPWKRRRK